MKPKVLDNVGDLFNELYYIYKDKYNEEKDGLNTKKNKKHFYYKKLRLTDDYQYKSEEEKQQTSKKSDKTDKMGEQPDESNLPEWVKGSKKKIRCD